MHKINYIQTNIQHICNIGPLIQWILRKQKKGARLAETPKGYVIGAIKKKTKKNN